jgi:putative Mg2+ transporter-C (MgtC) family protein
MLVGVGAALFVIAGNFAWDELAFGSQAGVILDPSRVVAYVVTGVGFLGAGAIPKDGSSIRGLTTAASLWVVAAIGVVVGSGMYWLGIFATAIVLLSLWPVRKLGGQLGIRSRHPNHVVVELEPGSPLAGIVGIVEASGVDVLSTSVAEERDRRRVVVALAGREAEIAHVLDRVALEPAVRSVSIGS